MNMDEALRVLALSMYQGAPVSTDVLREVQTGLAEETTSNVTDLTDRITGIEAQAGLEPGASKVYTRDDMDQKLGEIDSKQTATDTKQTQLEEKQTATAGEVEKLGEAVEAIQATLKDLPEKIHCGPVGCGSSENDYFLAFDRKSLKDGKFVNPDEGGATCVGTIYAATATTAGAMTAADKKKLEPETTPFVLKELEGDYGKAVIINEKDGGSLLYEFTDKGQNGAKRKISRVSVHDGSGNQVFAQIVAGEHDDKNHCTGTTLSVFEDKATYRSKANQAKGISDAELEIATKADITALEKKIEDLTTRVKALEDKAGPGA